MLKYNNQISGKSTPSGLGLFDIERSSNRNQNNKSMKVKTLYSPYKPLTSFTLWKFETPAEGTTINNFSITTTGGSVDINWGDSTSNIVNSRENINKTY